VHDAHSLAERLEPRASELEDLRVLVDAQYGNSRTFAQEQLGVAAEAERSIDDPAGEHAALQGTAGQQREHLLAQHGHVHRRAASGRILPLEAFHHLHSVHE
jgi:hypothetical protein